MSQTSPIPVPPAESGSCLQRIAIAVAVMVIAVIVLAELGILHAQSTTTDSSTKYDWNVDRHGDISLRNYRLVPQVTVAEKGEGRSIAEEAAKNLRLVAAGKAPDESTRFTITLESVSVNGTPWLPFVRTGAAKFTASYDLKASGESPFGRSTIHVHGKITGNVEQSMTGLSSYSLYRESMGKVIGKAITKEIQKLIAKN